MLPPMASSSMSAAAVVFRRYRPMPLSSYNALLSAVDTDRCRLHRVAVAFVAPLPSPAIVVRRCRRRSTLPSSKDAAVVVGCYYRMPPSATVIGCCGQAKISSTEHKPHVRTRITTTMPTRNPHIRRHPMDTIRLTNTTNILWKLLYLTHTKYTHPPTHWTQHI